MRHRSVRFGFLCFSVAQLVTIFGDRLHQFSVVGMIGVVSPGSSAELLKLALFIQLPVLLFAPVLGTLVDRGDKVSVMIWTDVFRGLLVLAIPTLFGLMGNLYAFYLPVALLAAGNMLFSPAKSAALPELFGQPALLRLNAVLWSVGIIGTLGGFLVGGWLFDYHSWRLGFYTDGASYLASVALLVPLLGLRPTSVAAAPPRQGREAAPSASGWAGRVRAGAHHLRRLRGAIGRNRPVAYGLAVQTLTFGAFGVMYVVGIAHLQASFPGGRTMPLAAVASAGTLGLLCGAAIASVLRRGHHGTRGAGLAAVACGAAWVGLGRADALAGMAVSAFVIGAGVSPLFVITETLLQAYSPEEYRGRVFAAREVLTRCSFIALSSISAALDTIASRRMILVCVGLVFAVAGVTLSISRSLQFSIISRDG